MRLCFASLLCCLLLSSVGCDTVKLQKPATFKIVDGTSATFNAATKEVAANISAVVVVSGFTAAPEGDKHKVSVEAQLSLTNAEGKTLPLPPEVASAKVEDLLGAPPASLNIKMSFPATALGPGKYTLKITAIDRLSQGPAELVKNMPIEIPEPPAPEGGKEGQKT